MYKRAPCDIGVAVYSEITCARLTVLEDRSEPQGPTVTLRVATIHTRAASPAADPILFANAGKGGDSVEYAASWASTWPFLADRDIIVMDGRGAGRSRPSLDCPEYDDVARAAIALPRDEAATVVLKAVADCRDRLHSEGHDLVDFDTAATAADLAELRRTLGIAKWNLYGISYGTRDELELMRVDPDGIGTVILDSPLPPDIDLEANWAPGADRAIAELFADCAADPTCSRLHPDPRKTFDELVRRLDASPFAMTVRDPWADGAELSGIVTGDTAINAVFDELYDTSRIPTLLDRIERTAADPTDPDIDFLATDLAFQAHGFNAEGVVWAASCREYGGWSDADAIDRAAASVDSPRVAEHFVFWAKAGLDQCDALGAGLVDPAARRPVVSDLPTLILSGALDPITPPAFGSHIAKSLSRSRHVTFADTGHGVLGTGACPNEIVTAFLRDPAAELDVSCAG